MDGHGLEDLVNPAIGYTSAAPNLKFNEMVKAKMKEGEEIAHFAFGQSPFPVPEVFVKCLREYAHEHAYLPMKGIPELREALSAFHLKYDNLALDPENFIVGPGSKELIYHILRLFNGVVFITSPTWSTYAQQCHLAGKQSVVLDLEQKNGWKISPHILNKGVNCLNPEARKGFKLLIMTNPGNPTGTCYTKSELQDIREFCLLNKVVVLSDEIYSRLTFSRKHSSMLQFYPEGTIMTNGFSKWASAGGWRIGYAYFPTCMRTLYEGMESSASNTYSCAPAPMQYAVAKALTEFPEELNQYLEDCSSILQLVGDFCFEELSCVGVAGHRSEAGYYYMPDFEVIRRGLQRREMSSGQEMTEAMMRDLNVALMASESFLRPRDELSVRFCFVCFDGEKILEKFVEAKAKGLTLRSTNSDGRNFVKSNCKTLVRGIERLKQWVVDLRGEQGGGSE